jgi:ribosomal protein S12 methylthiotransferase
MGSPVQVRPARIFFSLLHTVVDSEIIAGILEERGYALADDPAGASHIIVNTCGFIDEAKEEAIDSILELAAYRGEGTRLVVTGCLSQLYLHELAREIPEIDVVLGNGNLNTIVDAIEGRTSGRCIEESRVHPDSFPDYGQSRHLLTQGGYAYVKISEGCSGRCTFCTIPAMRGRMRSRPIDNIIGEVRNLCARGVREVVLTSQDTLGYGADLSKISGAEEEGGIRPLLERLLNETDAEWIRLLYLRPSEDLTGILDLFEGERLLPYFDIPVQHSAGPILKNMGRRGDGDAYARLISKIRGEVGRGVFRTSVIVGFPGEGEEEFRDLLRFVEEIRFNHLGVFVYSPQDGTPAARLKGRVSRETSAARRDRLMELQRGISHSLLQAEVGTRHRVLIEETIEGESIGMGRSYHFAPEVDGVFVVRLAEDHRAGDMVHARVDRADPYDLIGWETDRPDP